MTISQNQHHEKRKASVGQNHDQSLIDRFGIWLSKRAIQSDLGDVSGSSLADFGCGFKAEIGMLFVDQVQELIVADLSLEPALKDISNVTTYSGYLPGSLAERKDESIDFILGNNILEHLFDAQSLLDECFRLLRPGGKLFANVPSWRGKYFLEASAFKFGLSPAAEMNDHKMYYDPRELWPLLVRAGFIPQQIKIKRHKFGLNTKAIAIKNVDES